MKEMIMSIAQHFGGVQKDSEAEHVHQPQQQQNQVAQQQSQQSTLQVAVVDIEVDKNMLDGEKDSDLEAEDARKKQKQTHPKVFELPDMTNQWANSPQLLQTTLDNSNGSNANLSPTEEEHATMYD